MVSFFGLKLGSDRKKKGEKDTTKKDSKTIDRNGLGNGQYFGGTTLNKDLLEPSNIPRPGTSASVRSLQRPRLPYARGGGSSSMVDLTGGPGPSFHHGSKPSTSSITLTPMGGSEANMYMRFQQNASATSLLPPPRRTGSTTPSGSDGRPGTAGSTRSTRSRTWVNPLDIHFSRDSTASLTPSRPKIATPLAVPRPTTANPVVVSHPLQVVASKAPQIPKSPLGNFEFDIPSFDSGSGKKVEAEPKQNLKPTPLQQVRSRSPPGPKSYPSPPHSVKELEPPLMRIDTGLRPPSRQRDGSAGQDPRNQSRSSQREEPASLPSPAASAPRSSEEEKEKLWTGPVIQNVRAKRDTLTVKAPRRQSFSMDVDQEVKTDFASRPEPTRRPGTAGNGSPPPRSTRRPRPFPNEPAEAQAQPSRQTQSPPMEDNRGQWNQRGPSPFEERENRFQAPRPHDNGARQLREGSPYRRGPARQMDGGQGDPRTAPPAREREPQQQQWPDRGRSLAAAPPPNRPMPAIPNSAPRPPPQGQYRSQSRPPRDDEVDQQYRPQQEPTSDAAHLEPSPMPSTAPAWDQQQLPQHPAADPNHPSKGPQDFNSRPGFGQSSAKRRPPPPRLHPAPPPLRLRREVLDSPVVESSSAWNSAAGNGPPSNPITSAKFNTPRNAPSPPSTATTLHHPPSSPPSQQQLHPPPPMLDGPPRPAPAFVTSMTPDISSNPNWPLVDSGPPSAAFTLQSPDGVASALGGGGSKPASPAGMPLASPAFGTTFNLGGNSPIGPSHWTPQRPAHDRGRPDHGLRAPTGIADEFRVKFI
ncbi:hypothetical protein F5X68DRAFT_23259 [Plectosphaerella plurivora]|uniref:Uncharacterized protein n=1 Tax=Plectosphaerella plurivora TaxID=936078 RepID=A0A9P9A8M3_9PEZI|nr:hypothetical protein F5X68DRAFT_23259 [Plectosphaerella plurivora]